MNDDAEIPLRSALEFARSLGSPVPGSKAQLSDGSGCLVTCSSTAINLAKYFNSRVVNGSRVGREEGH